MESVQSQNSPRAHEESLRSEEASLKISNLCKVAENVVCPSWSNVVIFSFVTTINSNSSTTRWRNYYRREHSSSSKPISMDEVLFEAS